MPYKHFGARLARLDRFDSCTLHQGCAGSSTDQLAYTQQMRVQLPNGAPATPSTPKPGVPGTQRLRDWQIWVCTRLLIETKQVRFLHPAPKIHSKLRRRALHSTGSGQSLLSSECRFESGSAFQTIRGCGPTDEGARLRTVRSEFNSLHPCQVSLLAWSNA